MKIPRVNELLKVMTGVHCQPRNTELCASITKDELFFHQKNKENTLYKIIDPLVYFWPHALCYIILCRLGLTTRHSPLVIPV